MSALAGLISTSVSRSGADLVERAVFGTADTAVIASAFERLVVSALGTHIKAPMFYEASVGCVVGPRLDEGSKVVVKAFQPRWS